MGELVAQGSGGSATIGVLIGSEAESQKLRLEGFRKAISRYPGLSVAEVRTSNISRLQAAQQAEELLSRHPQVDDLVGFSALDAPGMLEAATRQPSRSVRLYGFDDLPDTTEGIRQCRIAASVVQQPMEMGYDAVLLLNDYFHGKTPPSRQFTEFRVIGMGSSSDGTGGACR
ncbi:substrate-binding domain-containing protein [Paenibacillus filicis]|uniref:Substrate-binding domain-containing protein n=1 Tax=Paenibacillus gyeongsangnamensis TaxID=3388067 RepID=A0ABT4QJW7_9BACL|nr:substrate-binding domain-containing protein [Paenibacillus filicis]MCZ8517167.1 substrate-binding domain-containing protein [Paenibacillus filicis]